MASCMEPQMASSSRHHDINRALNKSYFLSIDLSTAKMGLLVTDENLEVIFGEDVQFDIDLPEYGTQNGRHTDGEISTSPIHLHVKALDILLQKAASQVDLKRVKCICGSALQHSSVWWSKAASALLSRLAPHKPLHEQLPPDQTWTLPNPANFYDTSTDAQAQSLEWMIGGSEEAARRTGVRAFCRFTGLQIMKVQQTRPHILEATDRISSGPSFLSSLFLGSIAPLSESDAASMSLWNMPERRWDPLVLSVILGKDSSQPAAPHEVNRFLAKLGDPYLDNSVPLGTISSYFVRRYGFSEDCQISGFVGHHQATFMSQPVGPQDAIISLGDCDSDAILLSLSGYLPDSTRQILPNPVWSSAKFSSEMPLMALLEYKDADLARTFMRDTYCNASWQIFETLVTLISEGGTIGLDDKLFTFFWPHGELGNWQGISRFEGGQRIKEFKDRRANPRCLLESQFLKMRLQLARISLGLKQLSRVKETLVPADSVLNFDPYDRSFLPKRIISVGRAADSRAMTELLSSVLGAPVYRSISLAPSAHSAVFSGNRRAITSAALGSCYKAAWVYLSQFSPTQSYNNFLGERFVQISKRSRASEASNASIPLITTSLAGICIPEASGQSVQLDSQGGGYFSTANTVSSVWNDDSLPSKTANDPIAGDVPILTDSDDLENGLIKVAEPDDDLFQRYGGLIEEYARLEGFVRRGVL